MDENSIDVDGQQFYTGLLEAAPEEVEAFESYAAENERPFAVLGHEQYSQGGIIDYDDPDFQEFLEQRIVFAKKHQLKLIGTPATHIDQKSSGTCSMSSATGAQMTSVYNSTLFGVPAVVPRLNCSVAYLKAKNGRWSDGLSIVTAQRTICAFGNASVESAGEYQPRSPGKYTGFDNEKYQCWTGNVTKKEQVVRLVMAGVPVCYGSNTIPVSAANGKITKKKNGNHAQTIIGFDHTAGLVRYCNSWGTYYRQCDPENGWGLSLHPDEIDRLNIFGQFGNPYFVVGQECRLRQ